MELQSVPTEIDVVQRRLSQLELARRMLAEETEEHAVDRLLEVETEIADLTRQKLDLRSQWEMEKSGLSGAQSVRERLDEALKSYERSEVDFKRIEQSGQIPTADQYEKRFALWKEVEDLKKRLVEAESRGDEDRKETRRLLKTEVDPEEIAEVVSQWTGIPVAKMLTTEREKLLKLEDQIHLRMVDQEAAVAAVANAVRRSRAGLQDLNRPIGSFLFLGPTGVGKTELAKALAEFLFDSETAMIRLDMSEFGERHNVARLIGAPPGYVGYEEGGRLTEAVRRRPYAVVLLDEIEKAHRDVFNVLLQVLDDGRLTDGQGRTVDFRNTVIIMTSNLGSQAIAELAETADESRMRRKVMDTLRSEFLPEFLNRIDETIIFHQLGLAELSKIVDLQLRRLQGQLAEAGMTLQVDDDARARIVDEGFDPTYGARPLKRVIQQRIANPVATALLEGKAVTGQTIVVGHDGEGFTFKPIPAAAAKS